MKNQIAVDLIKRINIAEEQIVHKTISTVIELRKVYAVLGTDLEELLSKDPELSANPELKDKVIQVIHKEIERSFMKSYEILKKFFWGEFEKLNETIYPELCSIMIDKDGELHRVFDDFPGTIAVMDFHGYTKFSNDIKYNKTPLLEFGEGLPAKINLICKKCRSFVYEIEGDSLIIIGPDNPYYVLTAVISIIELAKQKEIIGDGKFKSFYDIDVKNSMIKKFEMNASITTGGQVFINKKGSLIGTVIAEASRILKIANMKMPEKSGLMISDKVYRAMEKFKNEPGYANISIEKSSNPYIIDVKGMRIKIREYYLESKKYHKQCDFLSMELYKLLKLKSPSKWYNILIIYTKLVIEVLKTTSILMNVDRNEYTSEGIVYMLEEYMVRWINRPTPDVAWKLLDIISKAYKNSNDVKGVIAIYYEFVSNNYQIILSGLEAFYDNTFMQETEKNPKLKLLNEQYNKEIENLKSRYFPRRMFETVLSDVTLIKDVTDIPYIGKD